jgi:hypothetical protein
MLSAGKRYRVMSADEAIAQETWIRVIICKNDSFKQKQKHFKSYLKPVVVKRLQI